MTKIEEVARAICLAAGEIPDLTGIRITDGVSKHSRSNILHYFAWQKYRLQALAAILAMRKPTEEMFDAVGCGGDLKVGIAGKMHLASFQGMIDGALNGEKAIDVTPIRRMIEGGNDAD